jgi:hypothetical protein
MSFENNFDYYLCSLSLLGLVLLYLLKEFQGETFLKNLEFAAVLMIIGPLLLSSFFDWTSYTFFMLLTFLVGLIFLIYGWYIEDRIYLTLASLTILTEVIYAFVTVEAGELFIKLLLLILGLVLILVGVYFRKKKILTILLLCLSVFAAQDCKVAFANQERKVTFADQEDKVAFAQYLVDLIHANPNDQLIRARLFHYLKKDGSHLERETQLSLSKLPQPTALDRFQRSFLRDDLAAITGIRAIEGTLQLDAMRQQLIRSEQPTIDISSVTPLTLASHDYPEMLEEQKKKGNIPEMLEVEYIIPVDTIYLRFPDIASFFQFIEVFDNTVAPMLNILTISLRMEGIGSLFEREFGYHPVSLRDVLQSSGVQGITIVIGDPSIHLGSDITLIFETANDRAAARLEATLESQEQASSRITKTYRHFAIVSNNRTALSQIGDIPHPLADAPDFLYMKSLQIPAPDGFLYFGEDFVKKLISPEFRMKDLRRHNCKLNLRTLQNAMLLYVADGHPVESVTIENLINQQYLESAPVDLTDFPDEQGTKMYRFDPVTETWSHTIYGQLGNFTPLNDLSVNKIRQIEQDIYNRFRLQYQRYFTRYIDPVGIGLSFEKNRLTLHTVILPLIDDPLYTSTVDYLGREQKTNNPSVITNKIPSNYGISLLLRSRFLKDILSRKHWIWNRYSYFFRDMQSFIGEEKGIFGSELFLGMGDFGFGEQYSSPQKPYPATLKEFSHLPFELPVVMIQSLADEKLGQDYLHHLFHRARPATVQDTPVYSFNLLGNIDLYGSVKNNLLTITSSLGQQKEILVQNSGSTGEFSELYHLTAMLQPEYLKQFRPHLFRMIQQQLHISCKNSLATLQNLLDLYIARYGDAPSEENIHKLTMFGNLPKLPLCPQNGTYSIQSKKVVCSIHGSLDEYHEQERLTDDFFLNPFFDRLSRLIAQLKFTQEGIVSKVQVELNSTPSF